MCSSGSREPAHWTQTTSLGTLPSDGRRIWPPVGPSGRSISSNCRPSITSGIAPAAVLAQLLLVIQIIACGDDDGANVKGIGHWSRVRRLLLHLDHKIADIAAHLHHLGAR